MLAAPGKACGTRAKERLDRRGARDLAAGLASHAVAHGEQHTAVVRLERAVERSDVRLPRGEIRDERSILVVRAFDADVAASRNAEQDATARWGDPFGHAYNLSIIAHRFKYLNL